MEWDINKLIKAIDEIIKKREEKLISLRNKIEETKISIVMLEAELEKSAECGNAKKYSIDRDRINKLHSELIFWENELTNYEISSNEYDVDSITGSIFGLAKTTFEETINDLERVYGNLIHNVCCSISLINTSCIMLKKLDDLFPGTFMDGKECNSITNYLERLEILKRMIVNDIGIKFLNKDINIFDSNNI